MRIGVPRELKVCEYRVAATPAVVHALVAAGHEVYVEREAGLGSGILDSQFSEAGAILLDTHEEVFRTAALIVKVKEPLPNEYALIRPEQIIFTYFHFAASRQLTEAMIGAGATCVAYETVTDAQGRLPLLIPMSEIAGRMAVQEGAKCLERPTMGRGILLGGVPGVERGHVTVLGGGVVGSCAARVAAGLGANVTLLDIDLHRLRYLAEVMPSNVTLLFSSSYAIEGEIARADLLIGGVLMPGARTPRLVTCEMLALMKPGAVVVDVSVDQGGCMETTRPTTHSDPTYVVDGVVHYCVANMPGAVGRTSTYALTNATLPYILELAAEGLGGIAQGKAGDLLSGLNIVRGKVTHRGVAETFGVTYCDPRAIQPT